MGVVEYLTVCHADNAQLPVLLVSMQRNVEVRPVVFVFSAHLFVQVSSTRVDVEELLSGNVCPVHQCALVDST